MITMPNRLVQARLLLEKGEPVPWGKLADLQVLDLVIMGRQFVEQAIKQHEAEDEFYQAKISA